ncbi:unnamed protein product, partial [Scytosiphon promiscuus]
MARPRFRVCNNQAVTISIFLCTLVSFFERMAFSIAFTSIAERNFLTETEKGLTLSSYYFGFTVSQIPGGYMTKRCGGKAILGLSFFLWAPLSAVLAATTKSGYAVGIVVACRLGIGLAQGILLPAAQSVLGHWTPPQDRGRHFAFAMSGMFAGAAIAMVTVPSVVSRFGAHTAFYVSACMGAVWLAGWIFTGSDAPGVSGGAKVFDGAPGLRSTVAAGSEDEAPPTPRRDFWAAAGMGTASAAWNFQNPVAAAATAHTSAVAASASCVCQNPGCCGGTPPTRPQRRCVDEGPLPPATASGEPAGTTVCDAAGSADGITGVVFAATVLADGAIVTTRCVTTQSAVRINGMGGGAIATVSSEGFVATCAAGGDNMIGSCGFGGGQGDKGAGFVRVFKETSTAMCWGEGKPGKAATRCGDRARRVAFPWRGMCASPAAWGCVAGNVGAGMAINVVMSWLPTYYEEFILVHLRDIHTVALLSPYLTMMAFSILGGVAYCWLTNTRGFSRALASRVISGAAFTLSVAVFPCFGLARSPAAATLFSSLALASAALSRGGWSTKHMEIAANPDHAAMLYAVANTISAAASVAGISATGKLLDTFGGGGAPRAWTVAMGAVGAACGVCGVAFVCCARGDKILFP